MKNPSNFRIHENWKEEMKRRCIWGGTPSAFSSVLLIRYWGRVDEFRVYKQTRFNYGHTCVAHDDSCWTVRRNI